MIQFMLGFIIGGVLGMFLMALVQINKDEEEK